MYTEALSANNCITNRHLRRSDREEDLEHNQELSIENQAIEKAKELINGSYSKEYDEFINEITWIDEKLAVRLFKLEKKLLTYKRINRLRNVMKSILTELAIRYFIDKHHRVSKYKEFTACTLP